MNNNNNALMCLWSLKIDFSPSLYCNQLSIFRCLMFNIFRRGHLLSQWNLLCFNFRFFFAQYALWNKSWLKGANDLIFYPSVNNAKYSKCILILLTRTHAYLLVLPFVHLKNTMVLQVRNGLIVWLIDRSYCG